MASIYEKDLGRTWDDTTRLPEKYKVSGKAGKAKVHIDSGLLGLEFFTRKLCMISCMQEPNWTGPGMRHSQSLRMFLLAATGLPGARLCLTPLRRFFRGEQQINTKFGFELDKDGFCRAVKLLFKRSFTAKCRATYNMCTWRREATIILLRTF
jgi:hypothetical protein